MPYVCENENENFVYKVILYFSDWRESAQILELFVRSSFLNDVWKNSI